MMHETLINGRLVRSSNRNDIWVQTTMTAVANVLTGLTTLHLNDLTIDRNLALSFKKYLPTIQELRFSTCTFDYVDTLFFLCSSFPRLSRLDMIQPDLDHSSIENLQFSDRPRPAFDLHLTSLSLTNRYPRDVVARRVLKWLLVNRLYGQVRSLKLTDITKSDVEIVQEFLNTAGPGLEHLLLGFDSGYGYMQETDTPLLNLSPAANLQTLGFAVHLRPSGNGEVPHHFNSHQPIKWIPNVLSTMASNRLKLLRFKAYAYGRCHEYYSVDWAGVVAVLKSRPSSSVEKILVDIHADSSWEFVVDMVKESMATLPQPLKIVYKCRKSL
ncbi:unnamed protein product [Somion occarium]|uniref:F-box/LRR-repeat protein n=1 Tax=Somion occarium TaxID=3059160 RepID=A0ABP1DHM8_9APHY